MSDLRNRPGVEAQPYVSFSVNGVRETRFIEDVQVYMEDGKHVVATVTVWYTQPRRNSVLSKSWVPDFGYWKDGGLVQLKWGFAPKNVTTLYGYIDGRQAKMREHKEGRIPVTYIIRGTSRPMQSYRRRDWGDVTASYVARSLAQEYGLRAVVDPTRLVLPSLTQTSSDFKFLVELSERSGHRLFIHNGDLQFIDPYRSLTAKRSGYPTFRMDRLPNQRDSLRDFIPTTGAMLPDGGRAVDRVMHVIDPDTGEVIPVKRRYGNTGSDFAKPVSDPRVSTTVLWDERPASTYDEARDLLRAQDRINRNWVAGEARTLGDARVQPGTVVNLTGAGLTRNEEGLWFVSKVVHRLHTTDPQEPRSIAYELDATLGRDGDARNVAHDLTPDWQEGTSPVQMESRSGLWVSRG